MNVMMLLPFHILARLIAILAGGLALFVAKGGKLHRDGGRVFVYAMLRHGRHGRGSATRLAGFDRARPRAAAHMVFPAIWHAIGMAYTLPQGIYEVGLRVWLFARGIRDPVEPPLARNLSPPA